MKKSKTDIVNGWLEKAGRDLEVAKRELSLTQPFTDIICFHAQQAVEKIMKAYLIHLETAPFHSAINLVF
jgi:HEPN domain-containing protein